jgi:hypothetical protein
MRACTSGQCQIPVASGLRRVPNFSLGFTAAGYGSRAAKTKRGNLINGSPCQNQNAPVPKSNAYDSGRTDIVKGRSVRSGGNVLTTLSCSASGIFAICCDLTRPTITRLARTFQSTRTRRRREQYMPLVAFCLGHFLADFIICMREFDFRQAQGASFQSFRIRSLMEKPQESDLALFTGRPRTRQTRFPLQWTHFPLQYALSQPVGAIVGLVFW